MLSPTLRFTIAGATVLASVLGATRVAAPPRTTIHTGTIEGVIDSATGVTVFRGIP